MSNLDFGPLVLGGNTFGWTSNKQESFEVLDGFLDAGGRAIDTADSYSAWIPGNKGGESESILGEWMQSRGNRDRVLVATKVASFSARPGLSPENVRAAVDESLERLKTDYLDVYYAHGDDDAVPQAEYVGVFDELVRVGKVREVGASNFSIARLASAVALAKDSGLTAFSVAQDKYNLVDRGLEPALPSLLSLGVTELPYAGLASGFLTGKYHPGIPVESARAGGASKYLDDPKNVTLLRSVEDVAAAHGVSVAAVALSWLRQQVGVGAPIASARVVGQLEQLIQSFTLVLSSSELERLS